jgi:hypothetical protein
MVEVSVAEDQCLHSGRVDFQQFQIVGIDARGEAEIQQIASLLAAPRRFDVQCQTPLAFKCLALRDGRKSDLFTVRPGRSTGPRKMLWALSVISYTTTRSTTGTSIGRGAASAARRTPEDTSVLPIAAEACRKRLRSNMMCSSKSPADRMVLTIDLFRETGNGAPP